MHTFEQKPAVSHDAALARPLTDPRQAATELRKAQQSANVDVGFDLSRIPVHTGRPATASSSALHNQVNVSLGAGQYVNDPLGSANLNPSEEAQPALVPPLGDDAQRLGGPAKVDSLKIITDKTGAFSGFPTVNGVDLNVPGPLNNTTTTGTCVNVHQMQFHLTNIDPNEVKLVRKIVRVASAGGKSEPPKGEKDKPAADGPSDPTVIRPKDSSSIVVSDSPGFIGKGDASKSKDAFPVSYDANFQLYAIDFVGPKILAKLEYTV